MPTLRTGGTFAPTLALSVIAIVASVAIYVQRIGSAFWHPYLYAEDGAVFLQEQFIYGIKSIFMPFAGYFHLVPRLTAVVAGQFSAVVSPDIYQAGSLFVVVWTAATISFCRIPHSFILAPLLFCVPHTGEVFGTITNAQWIMACALPLIASTPIPDTNVGRANQYIFVTFSGLSGPFAILALPLFAWRFARFRDRKSFILFSLIAFASAVQLGSAALNYVPFHGTSEPGHLAVVILDRWFGSLAYGWRSETAFALGLTCSYATAVAIAVHFSTSRFTDLGFLFYAGALLFSVWLKFLPDHSHHLDWPSIDDRYFFIPKVMVIWVFANALFSLDAAPLKRGLAAAALVLSLFKIETNNHDWWSKYNWPQKSWKTEATKLDKGEAVKIEINPPPYAVAVPKRGG